jgi:CHASE2 domain-containing sensor protein/tRNA A-37 threonylcarbamoyl transferase component Bud32
MSSAPDDRDDKTLPPGSSPRLDVLESERTFVPTRPPEGASAPALVGTSGTLGPGGRVGRYVIQRQLGQGGMGTVFLGYDPELDRRVAIKLLHPDLSSSQDFRTRFLREAQAMARISHPNVVAVHDIVSEQGQLFVAMEYVEGTTLESWLESPRSTEQILEMFRKAGTGLAAAHAAGLIHRDFKPANVLIGLDGSVQVSDFGLARAVDAGEEVRSPVDGSGVPESALNQALTRVGVTMGTPAYMSPEQLGAKPVDARGDQFSFCVALYEALYGQLPYEGLDLRARLELLASGKLDTPRTSRRVPPWLRQALLRGLSFAPEARFPSMEALLQALARAPHEEGRTERARLRQRLLRGSLLGALAIALIAVVSSTHAWRGFEERVQGLLLARHPRAWNDRVTIIEFDQETVNRLGWPIPRRIHAQVLEAVARAEPVVVGYDSFYYLPAVDGPEGDAAFGKVLSGFGRAVLAVPCSNQDRAKEPARLAEVLGPSSLPVGPVPAFRCANLLPPVEPLRGGVRLAQVTAASSASGYYRSFNLLAELGGRRLPTLALAMYLTGQGLPSSALEQRAESVQVGSLRLPVDQAGGTLASFRGAPPDASRVSFLELYDALSESSTLPPALAERLRDRYVLFGQTADSFRDHGPLATGQRLSLVYLHGALLGDLLDQAPMRELSGLLQFGLLLFLGALLTASALMLRPTITFAAVLMVLQGLVGGSLLLAKAGVLMAPLAPMAVSVLAFSLVLAGRLTAEDRERSLLRNALVGYVDPTDLRRILSEPGAAPTLTGARRRVSLLAVRVRAPEGVMGRLSPEDAVLGMRQAFQVLMGEVLRRKGRVEGVRGNGFLAVFGDPLALPEHAQRAMEAARALQEALDRKVAEGGVPLRLDIHAGVATGEGVVGDVAVEGGRMEYAVLGELPERAWELAGRAPRGGVLVAAEPSDALPEERAA